MPLILVLLPKDEKRIFQSTNFFGLRIRIESFKNQTRHNQCRNCQKFGHGQQLCRAPPKCLKCGKDHHITQCTKPKDIPATCANCGGPHTANYRNCPKHPENISNAKKSHIPQQYPNITPPGYQTTTPTRIKKYNTPSTPFSATRNTSYQHMPQTTASSPMIISLTSHKQFKVSNQMAIQLSNAFAPLIQQQQQQQQN